MADPTVQNTSNANPAPVNNGLGLPPGLSPRLIPLNVDLTVSQNVLIDLTQQQQGGQVGPIQSIYVNNSLNTSTVTITSAVLNQQYNIPAGSNAILPFFLPNQAPKFTVASTGGVIIPIGIFNIPLPAQVWSSFPGSGFNFSGGSLLVSDPILEGLITNPGTGNGLAVNILSGGSGGGGAPLSNLLLTGTTALTGTLNLFFGGSGALTTFITGVEISLSSNAVIAGGASEAAVGLSWLGGGGQVVIQSDIFVPAANATPPTGNNRLISAYDTTALASNANAGSGATFFWNGTTLTTGKFSVNVYGFFK